MSFIRHVGKHGDRKVAIVFRELPGEEHMCLVTYPDVLNRHVHDPLMKCIESDIGQNSENLADALHRTYTTDGKVMLQSLHNEGHLKKVNTEQIVVTPAPGQSIRLNELNKILDEMQKGEDAVKKLAEYDNSLGLQKPSDVAKRKAATQEQSLVASADGALTDDAIVNNLKAQAEKMTADANSLLAEAKRLREEAAQMIGEVSPITKKKPKVTTKKAPKATAKRVSASKTSV